MEDEILNLIKMKYDALHYPYIDKDFKPNPRKISDLNLPDIFSPLEVSLFSTIEKKRTNDPSVGAQIAGIEIHNNLMNVLKDKNGGVQIESLFAAIGSLAGRELLIGIEVVLSALTNHLKTEKTEKGRLLIAYAVGIIIADTKDGQKYLMGDEIANRFTRFFYTPISPNAKSEDLLDIAKTTVINVGDDYWKTSFDETIGVSPQVFADKLQAVSTRSLTLYCRYPYEKLLAYVIAAQMMIRKSNEIIEEKTALRILAEYGWKTSHFNIYF